MRGVLLDLTTDIGLDRAETEQALDSKDYANQLEQDTMLARQLGVTGLPLLSRAVLLWRRPERRGNARDLQRYGAEAAAAK